MKNKINIILLVLSNFFLLILLGFNLYTYFISTNFIYNRSLKSIVEVKCNTKEFISFGTAVFFSKNELITNYHVVSYINHSKRENHENIFIRFADSNDYLKANLKKYDEKTDLAIIKLDESVGKAKKIKKTIINIGEEVLIVGNANNLGISLTKGIISKIEVEIIINKNVNKYIQVDATSSSGVSGGALLDKKGRLIGIITLRLLDKEGNPIYGYVYAVPIDVVLKFINIK